MLCFELRRALRRAASCCAVSYRVGPRRANPRQYVYKTLDMPDCGTCRPTRKLMMKPPGVISSVLSGSVEPSRMKVEQEFLLSCAVLRRAPSCRAAPCCVWPRCAVPHGAASCCVGPRRAVCETPPLTQTNNVTVNSARRRRPSAAGRPGLCRTCNVMHQRFEDCARAACASPATLKDIEQANAK